MSLLFAFIFTVFGGAFALYVLIRFTFWFWITVIGAVVGDIFDDF